MILEGVLAFIAGVLLLKLSEIVVDRGIKIADILNISNFAVGFIFIAFMTSLPEFFVSTIASLEGSLDLAFGNVIGSNIVNICLVLGISAIYARDLKFSKQEVFRNTQIIFLISLLLLAFLYFGTFSRLFGIFLILVFLGYSFLISQTKLEKVRRKEYSIFETIGIIITFYLAVIGLIVSARVLVDTGLYFARFFNIPEFFIGLVFYSIGTSLPELMVNLSSLRKGVHGLAVGNILGSCVLNITVVLGASLLVSTSSVVNLDAYFTSIVFLIFVNMLLDYNIRKGKIESGFGLFLVVLYILFIATQSGLVFSK